MQPVSRDSFIASGPHHLSFDTSQDSDNVHVDVGFQKTVSIKIVLTGTNVKNGKQEIIFTHSDLIGGPVVIGFLNPDYLRQNANKVNLRDYLIEESQNKPQIAQVAEQTFCTIRLNAKDLLYNVSSIKNCKLG